MKKELCNCITDLVTGEKQMELITPKLYFDSEEEANNIFDEWKDRLFLNDWNIVLDFADNLDGNAGLSNVQWVNSCGMVTLLNARTLKKEQANSIEKSPQEQTMIHELLHFKYLGVEGNKQIEDIYYEEMQHRLLEQIAKSLYMAKYNIDYEWFKVDN